jgi:hypothetical protein
LRATGCDALSAQVGADVVRHLGLVADWLKLDPAYGFAISAPSDRQVELFSRTPGPKVSPCPHVAVVVAVGHCLGLLDAPRRSEDHCIGHCRGRRPAGREAGGCPASDALNLAVLTNAPVFVAPEMLADCIDRQEGDSAEAALLQRAIAAGPMAVRRADR